MSRLTERELDLIRRQRLAGPRETGRQVGAGFLSAIGEPIRRSARRRRTLAELRRLDDRMLQDIGLDRGQLELVAENLADQPAPKPRREGGLLAALRRRYQRQAAIRGLQALDDRSLNDIGILRSDIAGAVDRAFAAEWAAKTAPTAGFGQLLKDRSAAEPRGKGAPGQEPAALHAKAMAEQALEVASRRQAS